MSRYQVKHRPDQSMKAKWNMSIYAPSTHRNQVISGRTSTCEVASTPMCSATYISRCVRTSRSIVLQEPCDVIGTCDVSLGHSSKLKHILAQSHTSVTSTTRVFTPAPYLGVTVCRRFAQSAMAETSRTRYLTCLTTSGTRRCLMRCMMA